MTANLAPAVTNPNYFRPAENTAGTAIPKYRIVAISGAWPGCALATSAGATFAGVTVEEHGPAGTGGARRSVQTGGRSQIETGGAFARGVKLTSDSVGRAIQASPGDSVIGRAENASSGAGLFVMCEMELRSDAVGSLLMLEQTITHEDLDAAATSQTLNLGGALPEGARVVGVETQVNTAFTGGSVSAAVLNVGVSGALTALVSARDIFTGAAAALAGTGARNVGSFSEAQLQAQVTATGGNVSTLTAGSVTIRVFYAPITA